MSGMFGDRVASQLQRRCQHETRQVECERTILEGRADLETRARPRPPIDCIAEGMWKMAAGESCQESWLELSEEQRAWWRSCATECVRRWMTDPLGSYY
jgi:hypothetical protein